MKAGKQTDEKYWSEYDGLQDAKHSILRRYLDGWFPILSSWSGRVLYIDCHAGRGRHGTGHEGSPILAVKRLLEHSHIDKILQTSEVHFIFFEINPKNYDALLKEIEALGPMPSGIYIQSYCEDYETILRNACEDLKKRQCSLAPSFAFVDPYGFSLSMELNNMLLSFGQCELLINFMYRYIDMAIHTDPQADNMNRLFGCNTWKELRSITDSEKRAEACIRLFSDQLDTKYVTHMYMRASNNQLKYVLLHATNHPRGRELMKEAMWSVTPEGSFTAYERDHPDQLIFITPDPDLQPLEDRLWEKFKGRDVRINEVYKWLNEQLYLKKHLHKILRKYREDGIVTFSKYSGRFAFEKNPIIHFPPEKGN